MGSTLTFRTTSNKMIRRGTIIFIGKEGEGEEGSRRRKKGRHKGVLTVLGDVAGAIVMFS